MADPTPPTGLPETGLKLIKVIFDESIFDEVYGDLHELYLDRVERQGALRAKFHLYKDIFLSVRNYHLRRKKLHYTKSHFVMYKNYWKISFRNIIKNKIYSVLNISGLALGLMACFFILQYVNYERSYDQFHEHVDNLYRVQYNSFKGNEQLIACAAAVPRVGPFMKENMPEVVDFARAYPWSGVVSYGDVNFRVERIHTADPAFLTLFTFPLIAGDQETALKEPNTVVISKSLAHKIFGTDDVMGRSIKINGSDEFEITGVAKDVPQNSHIKFDLLVSFQTLNNETDNQSETSWGWYDFNTYVLLESGTDYHVFDEKFDKILFEDRKEDFEKYNNRSEFPLQPVTSIHLYSDLLQESEPAEQGDGNAVFFLTIIAVFILVIAWINYINLSTARSIERAKEVGIRKVIGAHKSQLIHQFLTESLIINSIAFVLAIISIIPLQSSYTRLSGIEFSLAVFQNASFWIYALLIFIAGATIAGIYPAFVLSSFNPAAVLKSKTKSGGFGNMLRRILVIFQFSASVGLIIGTLIVFQQLRYMQTIDLGFDMTKKVVVKGPAIYVDSLFSDNLNSLKTEAVRNANIRSVSSSSNVPGNEIFWTRGIRRAEEEADANKIMYIVGVDYQYFPALEIDIIYGRNFDLAYNLDTASVILNHKALSYLGFPSGDAALNQEIIYEGRKKTVVGVVSDYNQMSAKSVIAPMLFQARPNISRFITYVMENEDYQASLDKIEANYRAFFPGNPFEYYFLEDFFNEQYAKDRQFSQVFITFTILAIVVACLGLFGLSSLSTLQRSKEIGIRKSMGASIRNVIYLLSREFMILVLIANLVAWPVIYLAMDQWLEGFANRISIHWSIFVISAVLVGLIAFLTVAYNTFTTAKTNPINVLRYE